MNGLNTGARSVRHQGLHGDFTPSLRSWYDTLTGSTRAERALPMPTAGGTGPSRLPSREWSCDGYVNLACFERRRSAWEHLEAETRQTAMIDLFG